MSNKMDVATMYDDLFTATGDAYRSDRVLPDPYNGQEWYEPGIINGNLAIAVWYFDDDDFDFANIQDDDLPWHNPGKYVTGIRGAEMEWLAGDGVGA